MIWCYFGVPGSSIGSLNLIWSQLENFALISSVDDCVSFIPSARLHHVLRDAQKVCALTKVGTVLNTSVMGSQAGWHLSDNLYLCQPITKFATLATYERHLANQNKPYESSYTTGWKINLFLWLLLLGSCSHIAIMCVSKCPIFGLCSELFGLRDW